MCRRKGIPPPPKAKKKKKNKKPSPTKHDWLKNQKQKIILVK